MISEAFGRVRSSRHRTALMPKVWWGPGVTSPKSRSSGCRAGHAGHESFPHVLPGPFVLCVEDEVAEDGV